MSPQHRKNIDDTLKKEGVMKALTFAISLIILNGCAPKNQSNYEARKNAPVVENENESENAPFGANRPASENAAMVADEGEAIVPNKRGNSAISKVEAVKIISSVPQMIEDRGDSDAAGLGQGDRPMEEEPIEEEPMEEVPSTFKLKVSTSNDCEGWMLWRKVGPSRYRSTEDFKSGKEIELPADGDFRVEPFYDESFYEFQRCDDDESASCRADSAKSVRARGGDNISMNLSCSCSCR